MARLLHHGSLQDLGTTREFEMTMAIAQGKLNGNRYIATGEPCEECENGWQKKARNGQPKKYENEPKTV